MTERTADRPFVTLNMAMTADGKITSSRREYPNFTSAVDRTTMDRIRAECDAIVVGAGTLRADDPPMGVRDPAMRAYRRSLGKSSPLVNVVVTASADLDPSASFFDPEREERVIVATVTDAPDDSVTRLERVATVWRSGERRVDVVALADRLGREFGVDRLLLEGGGELNWEFVDAGLLDEVHVTIAPALLGGREAPTWLEGSGLPMDVQVRLTLEDVVREGDELFCRYRVAR